MRDPEAPATSPSRPLHQRVLALIALLGLLASAGWSSWAILTDQADFGIRARESAEAAAPAGQR
jgi:hypothetical protein